MRIGIDLGGTKTELIALGDDGAERLRLREPTPRGDYAGTIERIRAMAAEAEAALGVRAAVGVGIPGALSRATGLVKNANSTWMIGRPFDRDLARALDRPVRVANDANCLALSEAADGAAAGAAVVFAAILGTGVGGGIAVRGRLIEGLNAIAGEWGHNPLPRPADDERPGPECYCGRRGCIETFLSGPGLARDAGYERGEEVVAAAADGDRGAQTALERYRDRLARSLALVVNILDPDAVVLGGGLSELDGLCEAVTMRWQEHVFSDRVDTALHRAAHGASSGVRGAARLWAPGEWPG